MNLLSKKFDYVELPRVEVGGRRYYETPDKERVPSVTTILSSTMTEEKRAILKKWQDRVGIKQAEEIKNEAGNRGTRLHNYLEDYILTNSLSKRGSNPFSWSSHAMAEVIIAKGIERVDAVWGVEVPLYFPAIYAGTTDSVGIHNKEPAIMDYKQSNSPKKEEWIDDYKLQLAAYATAHNEVYNTNIRKGVIMMAVKPEVDKNGNIISEPEYQEFVVEGKDFDFWVNEWWKRLDAYYEHLVKEGQQL